MHLKKIIVYIYKKKSIKSLYIISWKVLDAFLWPFLVHTTQFTLDVDRINYWNDHWIVFVETSMSNTLSTAKFIWNFALRPEGKISFKQKKFGPSFLSLNSKQVSLGEPFRYRKDFERIRRMINVTIYDFRQVHLEPVKNAIFSPVKTFNWLFYRNYVFQQSQYNTDKCFWWYLQHNKDSKRMHSQKNIVYILKNSIKSLYIKSWKVLDAFVWPFLVLTTLFKLGVNKINHWNDHWNIFAETGISNTLSAAKLIWNFPLRPERKISVRQKFLEPIFCL